MIFTENFNPSTDTKLLCTCGHKLCDKRSVTQEHLNRIQVVRELVKQVMRVTSGGRCSYHPDEIHRTEPADHQKGVGIDIYCSNSRLRAKIIQAALKTGVNAIGIHKDFIHLGHRGTKATIVWLY